MVNNSSNPKAINLRLRAHNYYLFTYVAIIEDMRRGGLFIVLGLKAKGVRSLVTHVGKGTIKIRLKCCLVIESCWRNGVLKWYWFVGCCAPLMPMRSSIWLCLLTHSTPSVLCFRVWCCYWSHDAWEILSSRQPILWGLSWLICEGVISIMII